MATKLGLTRDQLASFLQDHEQIRQFERLFSDVAPLEPTTLLDLAINAGNAENKANQALALLDKLTAAVEGLQMAPPPREFKRARYGSFFDTTTQTATTINTPKAITFNSTDISNGVYIGSPTSRIYVDTDGVYNFQFSVQLDTTSGGVDLFWIWPRINGVNVANSASQIRIQGNSAEIFVAANFFLILKAGDYVELMFEVDDTAVRVAYFAATANRPAVPSIIVTVSNNLQGVQ